MSAALDVATGLVLMYLVLSLFCTTLNEFVANLLKLRAATLKAALEQLIDDPNLKVLFYNHGMIDGTRVASTAGDRKPVEALNAEALAAAALAPTVEKSGGLWGKFRHVADAWRDKHPSYLSGRTVAMALIGSLDTKNAVPVFSEVEQAVKDLPLNRNIRDALGAALAEAQGDIDKLRNSIATWYDDAMDRLSGAYQRYLKMISIVMGLLIAVVLNADTLHVATVLWQSPVLRSEMVQTAGQTVQANGALQPNAACTTPTTDDAKDLAHQTYNLCLLQQQTLALPIGWDKTPTGWDWFWKVLGLAMTAVALSLGAPFWFDLLSQFVNIRGSGNRPGQTVSQPGTTSNVQVTAQMLPALPAEAPAGG